MFRKNINMTTGGGTRLAVWFALLVFSDDYGLVLVSLILCC